MGKQNTFEGIFQRSKGERQIRKGYGFAFSLLLIACVLTLYMNKRMEHHATGVERTNKLINGLEHMLSRVKDGETGVRGYLITGNTDFLEPYHGSYEAADSILTGMQTLTAGNNQQESDLAELRKIMTERAEISRLNIVAFENNQKRVSDSTHLLMNASREKMDQLRRNVMKLQQHELSLLGERERQFKRSIISLNIITLVSLVFASLLVIFGFVTYSQENRSKKIAGEEYQLQLKKRVEELNHANAELIRMRSQEKLAATGRIARTIAHEVRNPLTNINLAVEHLITELPAHESTAQLFEMITRNSSRINQLISDLLNSTKFAELNFERIGVHELIDEALNEAADRIALTKLKVIKKYDADPCEVTVDARKIKIALLNIIINAVEAMTGEREGSLHIQTSLSNGKCRIEIRDNGTGMDPDSLNRVFDAYFTTRHGGNGLGLTNTQNIILNHKGEIFVESEKGKGTSFIILLDSA